MSYEIIATDPVETAECFYEGSAVSYATIMKACPCTADDITRAVNAGKLRFVMKRIGPDGQLLKGIAAAHVVPLWA